MTKDFQKVLTFIKQNNYEEAHDISWGYIVKDKDDLSKGGNGILTEDERSVFNYAICLSSQEVNPDEDNAQRTMGDIDPSYSGILAKEIKEFAAKYMDNSQWNNMHKIYLQSINKLPQDKKPQIGMTTADVLNSTWGKPENKNKTTNANGTSEQWVYSNSRYIYLDNGIVTSIQSH